MYWSAKEYGTPCAQTSFWLTYLERPPDIKLHRQSALREMNHLLQGPDPVSCSCKQLYSEATQRLLGITEVVTFEMWYAATMTIYMRIHAYIIFYCFLPWTIYIKRVWSVIWNEFTIQWMIGLEMPWQKGLDMLWDILMLWDFRCHFPIWLHAACTDDFLAPRREENNFIDCPWRQFSNDTHGSPIKLERPG